MLQVKSDKVYLYEVIVGFVEFDPLAGDLGWQPSTADVERVRIFSRQYSLSRQSFTNPLVATNILS
jgi:hypothetical protein